jgi:hypothetical protein
LPNDFLREARIVNVLAENPIKTTAIIGVILMMVACNVSGLRTSAAPAGQYDCYGHEAGMLAYTGLLDIQAGGRVEFLGNTGSWTYDDDTQTLTFDGDVPLARAEYHADGPRLSVDLRPGVNIPHAELGTMTCDPR